MKINLFCKCGAGAQGEIGGLKAAEKFRKIWYQSHDGPGHGDCEEQEAVEVFKRQHGDDPR